jgi:hypothetical protein
MMAWIESSGLISADHPPLGLSPNRGAAAMRVMRNGGNPAAREGGMVLPRVVTEIVDGSAHRRCEAERDGELARASRLYTIAHSGQQGSHPTLDDR